MKRQSANIFLTIVAFLMVTTATAEEIPQQGFTTSTLREPIFDDAQIAVEGTVINNWLNENYQKLTDEQMKGLREHLYYLIDSRIKGIFIRDSVVLPSEHDLILEVLFSWAERLGVYGGVLAYNAVKSAESPAMEPLLDVPDWISIILEKDLFLMSSTSGSWSVSVPYYFMIFDINEFNAKNGMPLQLISLSTGAAIDRTETGRSQATLMIGFSEGADIQEFTTFWVESMGIGNDADRIELPVADRMSLHSFDAGTLLHTEITTWESKRGSYAVMYLGMDGTYQWNRPHYLNFLSAFKTGEPMPPNQSVQSDQPSPGR
jgi:hypothetical protein